MLKVTGKVAVIVKMISIIKKKPYALHWANRKGTYYMGTTDRKFQGIKVQIHLKGESLNEEYLKGESIQGLIGMLPGFNLEGNQRLLQHL